MQQPTRVVDRNRDACYSPALARSQSFTTGFAAQDEVLPLRARDGTGMTIEERQAGDVTILALAGKLTLGQGDRLLKDKISSVVRDGPKRLLLDLSEVPYVDSAGLGELVRTYTAVNRNGGQLKLLGLAKRIKDLFALTKLLTVFEIFETEQEALDSFSS